MQTMTRRHVLDMAINAALLCASPLCLRAVVAARQSQFQGHFLLTGAEAVLQNLDVRLSSNDKEVDQLRDTVEQALRREFRVSADTWFFNERKGDLPAFAVPLLRRGAKGDGTVYLGLGLLRQVTARNALNRQWQTRFTAIMAHEWAHIVQFSRGQRGPVKERELHADFLAGWFLSRTGAMRDVPAEKQREEALYRFGLLGDNSISDPDHHGTMGERASAIVAGFDLGAKVASIDVAFRSRSVTP